METQTLDVMEVAAWLRVHHQTIRKLAKQGKFPPPLRIGKALRWRAEDLIAWQEAQWQASRERLAAVQAQVPQ